MTQINKNRKQQSLFNSVIQNENFKGSNFRSRWCKNLPQIFNFSSFKNDKIRQFPIQASPAGFYIKGRPLVKSNLICPSDKLSWQPGCPILNINIHVQGNFCISQGNGSSANLPENLVKTPLLKKIFTPDQETGIGGYYLYAKFCLLRLLLTHWGRVTHMCQWLR